MASLPIGQFEGFLRVFFNELKGSGLLTLDPASIIFDAANHRVRFTLRNSQQNDVVSSGYLDLRLGEIVVNDMVIAGSHINGVNLATDGRAVSEFARYR
jgi:hypothetical protein